MSYRLVVAPKHLWATGFRALRASPRPQISAVSATGNICRRTLPHDQGVAAASTAGYLTMFGFRASFGFDEVIKRAATRAVEMNSRRFSRHTPPQPTHCPKSV